MAASIQVGRREHRTTARLQTRQRLPQQSCSTGETRAHELTRHLGQRAEKFLARGGRHRRAGRGATRARSPAAGPRRPPTRPLHSRARPLRPERPCPSVRPWPSVRPCPLASRARAVLRRWLGLWGRVRGSDASTPPRIGTVVVGRSTIVRNDRRSLENRPSPHESSRSRVSMRAQHLQVWPWLARHDARASAANSWPRSSHSSVG